MSDVLPVASAMERDRVRGCLLAGAVGDALGAPVEFLSLRDIVERYGPDGLRDFDTAYGRRGAVTDDTQMSLFTLEGLLRASVRGRTKGIVHVPSIVVGSYLRWLAPQVGLGAVVQDGWLASIEWLRSRRSPGTTCSSALVAIAEGREAGSLDQPINDSKGCGGVMRAAPVGFVARDPGHAFELGSEVAAITHGHPAGHEPAGFLAAVVYQTVRGRRLLRSVDVARELLAERAPDGETMAAVDEAMALARRGRPSAADIETLGSGWTGEEALAIALCCALAGADLEDALLLAVNHSGDSDSTGAIAGNIVGSTEGADAIPVRWLEELEGRDVIEALADDVLTEFGGTAPDTPAWFERYPPW